MNKPIEPGDMVAFPVDGIYVTARVTKVMTHNLERFGTVSYLVKTPEGHLHAVSDVLPMRNAEESEAVVRLIAGLPNSN